MTKYYVAGFKSLLFINRSVFDPNQSMNQLLIKTKLHLFFSLAFITRSF